MTKREICERLIDLRDQLETGWQRNDVPARELCRDAVYDLRVLLLDLAAPETEEEKEAAFRERCRAVLGNVSATGKKEPEKEEDDDRLPEGWTREEIMEAARRAKAEEEKEPPTPESPRLWVDGSAPLKPCPKCGSPTYKQHDSGEYFCPFCNYVETRKREEGEK